MDQRPGPLLRNFPHRAPHFRMQYRGRMSSSAGFRRRRRPCRSFGLGAVDPEPRPRRFEEVASSSPITSTGERSSIRFAAKGFSMTAIAAARRVVARPSSHLQMGLFNHGDDLANDGAHWPGSDQASNARFYPALMMGIQAGVMPVDPPKIVSPNRRNAAFRSIPATSIVARRQPCPQRLSISVSVNARRRR